MKGKKEVGRVQKPNGSVKKNWGESVFAFDESFMLEALEEAKKAFTFGEVPVGAVAVYEGSIVARTFNKVESLRDASAHAELLCLREAAEVLGRWRLSGVTLYTTLEPCCMCAGALLCFRIDRLVWGAPDIRQGADGSFASLLSLKHPIHEITITRNILSESSSLLMKTFFEQRRKKYV